MKLKTIIYWLKVISSGDDNDQDEDLQKDKYTQTQKILIASKTQFMLYLSNAGVRGTEDTKYGKFSTKTNFPPVCSYDHSLNNTCEYLSFAQFTW